MFMLEVKKCYNTIKPTCFIMVTSDNNMVTTRQKDDESHLLSNLYKLRSLKLFPIPKLCLQMSHSFHFIQSTRAGSHSISETGPHVEVFHFQK